MQISKAMWRKSAAFLLASVLGVTCVATRASQARVAKTASSGDIVYGARYYLKPGTREGQSHYHLYRINPDGSGKRQITFGAHDDDLPLWSPNGKTIAFLRDDKALLLANADGTNITKLLDLGSTNTYWDGLKWSPDGKNIGFIHHAKVGKLERDVLHVVNVRTLKTEQIEGVSKYAWSPDSRKLMLDRDVAGIRVLDWPSQTVQKMTLNPSMFAWLSNDKWVGTIETDSNDPGGIKQLTIYNLKGETVANFPIPKNQDGDYADWRSYVEPIPNTSQAFLFASDESTSSGHEDVYYRASAVDGHMARLAEGQAFAFAPDGKRFLNVSYRDTPSYDTLPNGHKRLVYTTKLQIGTSEKDLRDIVSGFVYVDNADWRAPR